MTEFLGSATQAIQTPADTLTDPTNQSHAKITDTVEGLYDTVASEDGAAAEAVYSVLDRGTGTTSENEKPRESIASVSLKSELQLDSDPIYYVLESDDYQV